MDELGKIRRFHRKERLKISKIAKFESDLLKTNKDIAPEGGGGGGHSMKHWLEVCRRGPQTLKHCMLISIQSGQTANYRS